MGDVYLDLTVINDSDPEKQMELQFLADTGATRAWIPSEVAKKLDIEAVGDVPLQLANGRVTKYPYGLCKFEYEGEIVNGTVVIGPKGIEPIAGTHVLQDFRLVVDVTRHTIRRARAMKAKSAKRSLIDLEPADAADSLAADYLNDKALTAFTVLDGEDFLEEIDDGKTPERRFVTPKA